MVKPETTNRMNAAIDKMLSLPIDQWVDVAREAIEHERKMQHHRRNGGGLMFKLLDSTFEDQAEVLMSIAATLRNEDLELDPSAFQFQAYEVLRLAVISKDYPKTYDKLIADAKNGASSAEMITKYKYIAKNADGLLTAGTFLCLWDEKVHDLGKCTLAETFKAMTWMVNSNYDRICGMFPEYARLPLVVGDQGDLSALDSNDVEMRDVGSKRVTRAKTTKPKEKGRQRITRAVTTQIKKKAANRVTRSMTTKTMKGRGKSG